MDKVVDTSNTVKSYAHTTNIGWITFFSYPLILPIEGKALATLFFECLIFHSDL